MKIRIVLAEDHAIMRDGLRILLSKEQDMEVVGEASNGRDAVQLAGKLSPDIIIMDVTMPDLNGIEATRQITKDFKRIKVIALSMHSNRQFIIGMLRAGVSAYLLKDCAFDELFQAIRAIMAGQIYLSPKIAGIITTDYVRFLKGKAPADDPLLTDKQKEILQLIAEGVAIKEIAVRLDISPKTVQLYRQSMMKRLGIRSIPELTKYAVREGLTSVEK